MPTTYLPVCSDPRPEICQLQRPGRDLTSQEGRIWYGGEDDWLDAVPWEGGQEGIGKEPEKHPRHLRRGFSEDTGQVVGFVRWG